MIRVLFSLPLNQPVSAPLSVTVINLQNKYKTKDKKNAILQHLLYIHTHWVCMYYESPQRTLHILHKHNEHVLSVFMSQSHSWHAPTLTTPAREHETRQARVPTTRPSWKYYYRGEIAKDCNGEGLNTNGDKNYSIQYIRKNERG